MGSYAHLSGKGVSSPRTDAVLGSFEGAYKDDLWAPW